jgi:hypothetical protein
MRRKKTDCCQHPTCQFAPKKGTISVILITRRSACHGGFASDNWRATSFKIAAASRWLAAAEVSPSLCPCARAQFQGNESFMEMSRCGDGASARSGRTPLGWLASDLQLSSAHSLTQCSRSVLDMSRAALRGIRFQRRTEASVPRPLQSSDRSCTISQRCHVGGADARLLRIHMYDVCCTRGREPEKG